MASLLEAVEEVNTAKNPYADMICEQRFEDTSLKKQNEEELQTIMQKSGKLELADLGDLVLWNILGYATDSENVLFLLQVSKEWKQYVFIIIPLPILRIRFDSEFMPLVLSEGFRIVSRRENQIASCERY